MHPVALRHRLPAALFHTSLTPLSKLLCAPHDPRTTSCSSLLPATHHPALPPPNTHAPHVLLTPCSRPPHLPLQARLFGDSATLALIMEARDPGCMKALGRQVAGFKPDVWDAAAFDLVVRGNFLKFGADPELREVLLGTGDALLVETAPEDR